MFVFPWSNLHELNLDWILQQVKQFAELIPPMSTAVEDVQALQTDVEHAVEDANAAVEDAAAALETAEEAKEIAEQAAQGTIADGAVTTVKLDDGAVTTPKIADGAVTGAKIANGTIAAENLGTGCVTTTQILDGTISPDDLGTECVTNSKLGTAAVTTAKINDGAVTTAKINDGAVTNGKLADNAVTEVKIADGSVTYEKLNSNAKNESASGYCKMPDYTLIEYGQVLSATVSGQSYSDFNVTFAKAYDSIPYVLVSLLSDSTSPEIGNITPAVLSTTTSGFVIRLFNNGSTSRSPVIRWLAIGRW